jgi:membrane-bound lytic murein transglycosylase B
VYGIPLDGTEGTKAVPDTDKGALDLDPTFDRAVGVMQFLPGTWKRYAEDESGDKVIDPQNLYDAALAAGKLLCSSASRLDTDDGLRTAYFAYNHSDDYVATVLQRAHEYEALPVPAPPSA